jgi:sigma-E factor negative regulatory protein RseA
MNESMSDQIRDQISAFLDDELSGDESAFLVRRLESNVEAHRTMIRYATIGAALRGELLKPEPDVLRRRLALRFEGGHAPALAAPRAARAGMRWSLLGFGLAASLGVLGLLVLQMVDSTDRAPAPMSAQDASSVPVYAAPGVLDMRFRGRTSVQPTRLTNYMVHHGEFASGLGRTWIHANVVGSREVQSLTEDASWRQ